MAALVERGAVAESEIVAVLQEILPPQLQELIPAEMKAVAVQRPEVVQQQAQEAAYEEPPLSAEQLSISQSGSCSALHLCSSGLPFWAGHVQHCHHAFSSLHVSNSTAVVTN